MTGDMKLDQLNSRLIGKTISESLNEIVSIFPGKVVFTTSFGTEDQILTHIIFKKNIPIEVITLDTGRLFLKLISCLLKLSPGTAGKYRYIFRTTGILKRW